jgi:hypothetical protein
MSDPDAILDYAPPPHSLGRTAAELAIKALRYAHWFIRRRPLRAAEVFVAGWLLIAAAWVIQALACDHRHIVFTPVIVRTALRGELLPVALSAVAGAVLVVALVALVRVAAQRRWRAMLLCMSVALPSGIASGMLQYERCPHATYAQVFGASIPVVGDACRNDRNSEPWWLRD